MFAPLRVWNERRVQRKVKSFCVDEEHRKVDAQPEIIRMYLETTPQSWDEAKRVGALLSFWVFRGHTSASWTLTTALERAADRFKCSAELRWIRERMLLHEFRRRAHHYIPSPPSPDEYLEWLALVQHHGGPTRLLDFTESFYVASFFAVETAEGDACVWAVNNLALQRLFTERTGGELNKLPTVIEQEEAKVRFAEKFVRERDGQTPYVISVEPIRQNQRLAIQKGLFLFPCDVNISFESNLCATFGFPFSDLDPRHAKHIASEQLTKDIVLNTSVVKITFPRKWHAEAYLDLYSMNLDATSLFPGLDGFARSLQYHLRCMEPGAYMFGL